VRLAALLEKPIKLLSTNKCDKFKSDEQAKINRVSTYLLKEDFLWNQAEFLSPKEILNIVDILESKTDNKPVPSYNFIKDDDITMNCLFNQNKKYFESIYADFVKLQIQIKTLIRSKSFINDELNFRKNVLSNIPG